MVPPIVLVRAVLFLDGGTILLTLRDGQDRFHTVRLVQSMFRDGVGQEWLPGRLYLNATLLAIRSSEEDQVLTMIRQAPIRPDLAPEDERPQSATRAQVLHDACERLREQLLNVVTADAYTELIAPPPPAP
jgi:hypothetical protein